LQGDEREKRKGEGCMHGPIIDMIFSSMQHKNNTLQEFPQGDKTCFSLLHMGKIKSGTNSL
jgi:hypothetical protein